MNRNSFEVISDKDFIFLPQLHKIKVKKLNNSSFKKSLTSSLNDVIKIARNGEMSKILNIIDDVIPLKYFTFLFSQTLHTF